MICGVGTVASAAAGVVGFLPPSQLGHVSRPLYILALIAGTLLIGLLPPLLLHRLRRPGWRAAPQPEATATT